MNAPGRFTCLKKDHFYLLPKVVFISRVDCIMKCNEDLEVFIQGCTDELSEFLLNVV